MAKIKRTNEKKKLITAKPATKRVIKKTVKKPTKALKHVLKSGRLSKNISLNTKTVDLNSSLNVKDPLIFKSEGNRCIVNDEQIESGVDAFFKYLSKRQKKDTILFDDEESIFLHIAAVKVPLTPLRQVRLVLQHGLLNDDSEICFIVKDLRNNKVKEYDEAIEYYEKRLNKHGITNIKTIMPFHQFKSEYGNQFEMKRKLLGLYDYFLVDSRISEEVNQMLGKIFWEKRKTPVPVKLQASQLKTMVERSLRKTILSLHSKGDSYIVEIGQTNMKKEHAYENITTIVDQLDNEFPGGLSNIRSIGIKTPKSLTIPLYLTLKRKDTIKQPKVLPKRPKMYMDVSGELTTYLNKNVTVSPTGKVTVQPITKNYKYDVESDNEETEIELKNRNDVDIKDEENEETAKRTELDSDSTDEEVCDILENAEKLYLEEYNEEQQKVKNKKGTNKTKTAKDVQEQGKKQKAKAGNAKKQSKNANIPLNPQINKKRNKHKSGQDKGKNNQAKVAKKITVQKKAKKKNILQTKLKQKQI